MFPSSLGAYPIGKTYKSYQFPLQVTVAVSFISLIYLKMFPHLVMNFLFGKSSYQKTFKPKKNLPDGAQHLKDYAEATLGKNIKYFII